MSAYTWTIEWARASRIRTLAKLESPSTNTEAKEQLSLLGHRSLVIADHQTAGRGRGNHAWTDSAGQALLSSWIFQVDKSPQPIFSALVGLALFEAANQTWPKIQWALRAPNDLHIVGGKKSERRNEDAPPKKIAGLLIELVSAVGPAKTSTVSVIVGLGLNVNGAPSGTTPYPATSLAGELAQVSNASLGEAEWGRFLKTWVDGCEARLAEGTVPELEHSSREALRAALARHPEFRNIEEVRANGSIVFTDGREISWNEL